MHESSQPPESTLDDIDRMVHEPARLLILSNLYVIDAADFVFIQNQTGLTRGNLSSHMSKLEAAGYIGVEKDFVDKHPRTLLRLTETGRTAFKQYIDQMRHLINGVSTD